MTRLKRFRARFKREKCKYKRCGYRRTHPVEEPRYCVKHVDIGQKYFLTNSPAVDKIISEFNQGVSGTPTHFKYKKISLQQRIKSFIFVDK